jgi:hypothetical protein
MKHLAGIICLLATLVLTANPQSIPKELISVPARLELDKPTIEVKAGATVNYTVSLKDAANQPIAAPNDLILDVNTPSGTQTVVMPKGQSSANFTWQATTPGVVHTTVRSGKLHPASGLVLVAPKPISEMMRAPVAEIQPLMNVRPAANASPSVARPQTARRRDVIGAVTAERAAVPATQPSAQPAANPAPPPPAPQTAKIQIFVTPLPVSGNAIAHTWTAAVSIAALSQEGGFLPVTNAVPIHFTSGVGQISPSDVTLQPGDLSTFGKPAILTSARAGKDTVQAISSLGTAGPVEVDYLLPPPTQLRISLGVPQVLANGSSTVTAQVCLLDEAGVLTVAADSVNIVLSPAGQFSKGVVPIAANSSCSDMVTWTAAKSGLATVIAESTGLPKAESSVTFPAFPWYLVWLAALGGIVGALVLHSDGLFSSQWWAHAWRGLVVGALMGAIVYLLARFGAVVLPSSIPVKIQNIPVVSGAGSFLLGFVGGVYGRKLLKIDENQQQPPKPPAAVGQAAGGNGPR